MVYRIERRQAGRKLAELAMVAVAVAVATAAVACSGLDSARGGVPSEDVACAGAEVRARPNFVRRSVMLAVVAG